MALLNSRLAKAEVTLLLAFKAIFSEASSSSDVDKSLLPPTGDELPAELELVVLIRF